MKKQLLKDTLVWGFLLWFFGYVLGFVFFAFVPLDLIGWFITPFGVMATLWVLFKKVHSDSKVYYLKIGSVWVVLAIVLDYLLLVQLLNPADGYYKFDVYVYYTLTLLLPVLVGWYKSSKTTQKKFEDTLEL